MKTILLTFDYELFSKVPGTVQKCMIEPTNELIKIFDRYGIKTTFFVDTLSLNGKAINQLTRLASAGHQLGLHIHPPESFNIHDLSDGMIYRHFSTGIRILESIGGKITAYRAGGWCLQPFDRLKPYFVKHGITTDSSVANGFYRDTPMQYYDFRNAPEGIYTFENDPMVAEPGQFTEIPITTYRLNIFEKLKKRMHKVDPSVYGNGISLGIKDVYPDKWGRSRQKIRSMFSPIMYSLQNARPDFMINLLKNDPRGMINFISHPKNLNKKSLELLEKMAREGYEFLTLKDYDNRRTKSINQ